MVKDANSQQRSLTRRDFISTSLKAGAAAFTTGLLPNLNTKAASRYNVLFILADDLRPMLGCYGHPEMHTPNIDALAERGTLFHHAYCQYPLCSPSRTSVLTGLRPETTNVLDNRSDFRKKVPDAVTLPQHFKAHGYHTQSVGRIAHLPRLQDDAHSFSLPSWRPTWFEIDIKNHNSWSPLDVTDDELADGKAAKGAIKVLESLKNHTFFLAVGFYKPHLPLEAPRKYFELYDTADFTLPASPVPPEDAPARALNNWSAIRAYADLPPGNEPLSDEQTLALIRAYAAATSYTDAQIGRVLAQLDALGLTENTVIVFCSDHGHHLGEQGMWGKQTLFESSLRVPLIVSVPGSSRAETDALVELVDIFPTLSDVCELPSPLRSEGTSLQPVLENPRLPWKTAAFSQFASGRSIRTARYRYTEWGSNGRRGKELYDYQTDPHETRNIVNLPGNTALVAHLSERLKAGWQRAVPGMQEHVPVPQTQPADVNNDGVVNIQDLVRVANKFGESGGTAIPEDVNNDGVVDIRDLVRVANHFGN